MSPINNPTAPLSDARINELLRECAVEIINKGRIGAARNGKTLDEIAAPLHRFSAPDLHVGRDPKEFDQRMTDEWYAGQVLAILEGPTPFPALGSVLNQIIHKPW